MSWITTLTAQSATESTRNAKNFLETSRNFWNIPESTGRWEKVVEHSDQHKNKSAWEDSSEPWRNPLARTCWKLPEHSGRFWHVPQNVLPHSTSFWHVLASSIWYISNHVALLSHVFRTFWKHLQEGIYTGLKSAPQYRIITQISTSKQVLVQSKYSPQNYNLF